MCVCGVGLGGGGRVGEKKGTLTSIFDLFASGQMLAQWQQQLTDKGI